MAGSKFTEKDHGFDRFVTQFTVSAGETAAFVGYLRSSGPYDPSRRKQAKRSRAKGANKQEKPVTPLTLAQLAAIMVYGSSDGRIPARDFMSKAIRDHASELQKTLKKLAVQVAEGSKTKRNALGVVAQMMVDYMVQAIDSDMPPKNAASTVARKGSSHTLFDTGQLRNMIDWEIQSGKKR